MPLELFSFSKKNCRASLDVCVHGKLWPVRSSSGRVREDKSAGINPICDITVKNVVVQGWTKNCAPLAIYLRSEECTASAVVPLIRVPLFLTATQPLLYLLYLKYPIQVDRVLEHVAFLMVHIDSTKLP